MFTEAHNFADDRERAWLLDSFERSANPVISLYATVEKLIGPGERLPHSGGVM
jgi:hypothetical protein